MVTKALAGDMEAARIVVNRLYPKLKPRELPITLPKFEGTLTDTGEQVLNAMAAGKLNTDQAANVLNAIAQQARIAEFDEFKREIAEMKQKLLPREK